MNADDDHLIDLLVDGELDPDRRRELLARLDADPEGWRRCALAFLEAQGWRQALRPHAAAATARPAVTMTLEPKLARRPRMRALPRLAGLAAALLAAFLVGRSTVGARPPVASAGPEIVRTDPPDVPAPAPADTPRQVATVSIAGASPERVPLLEGPGLDEQWALHQPPAVPEYVRSQWERRGYEVEQSRRLISVDLDDGRRVAVPLDEVQLHYVGRPVY